MNASDPTLTTVLGRFGLTTGDRIGAGGEATVFALGTERVLRVAHIGATDDDLRRRYDLLAELPRASVPFALPEVLDVGETLGRRWAIERRLEGVPLDRALGESRGSARTHLVTGYLAAAAALGALALAPRPWFGDLIGAEPVRADTLAAWLLARAAAGLAGSTPDLQTVDPVPIASDLGAALGADAAPTFVHLDVTPQNVLTEYGRITAVLDIGPSAACGDPRLDPVAAAVYLCEPAVTPGVTADDAATAHAWLREAGLDALYAPVRRWLGAYWAFATADPAAIGMCRAVLLDG